MILAELLPAVRSLSTPEKLELVCFLVEQLDVADEISLLEPDKTYVLPTPYNSFGAGAILMDTYNK